VGFVIFSSVISKRSDEEGLVGGPEDEAREIIDDLLVDAG